MKLIAILIVGALIGSALSSLGGPGPTKADAEPVTPPSVSPDIEATTPPSSSPTPTAPAPSPSNEDEAHGANATVTRVIDGDTIEAEFRGGIIDVRLIGVDTPETVHPSEPVECYGPAASKFTTRALEGEQVRLEFDLERQDRYDRTRPRGMAELRECLRLDLPDPLSSEVELAAHLLQVRVDQSRAE